MNRKIFNKVYVRFFKKDYFSEKQYLRQRITEAKILQPDIKIPLGYIKVYLKKQKAQCYDLAVKRLKEYAQGVEYPKREAFTWAIIKEINR